MSVVKIGPSQAFQEKYGLFKNAIVLTSPQQVSDVFHSPKPSVILVYWKSCGHCHEFAPIYDDAAAQYAKQVKLYAIEVEHTEPEAQMPQDAFFKESGVPRVAAVNKGSVIDTVKGNNPTRFKELLKKLLSDEIVK
jgi:thioredoxin-like negative regulator of GroEL